MGMWKIRSSLEEWETVAQMIEDDLCEFGFSNKFAISLMLAMDEIFANIAAYAYEPEQGEVIVKSEYEKTSAERIAKITFIDHGKEFNPLKDAAEPDVSGSVASKRKIGGLGIFLTKKQVDELNYSYINASNNLTLLKKELI